MTQTCEIAGHGLQFEAPAAAPTVGYEPFVVSAPAADPVVVVQSAITRREHVAAPFYEVENEGIHTSLSYMDGGFFMKAVPPRGTALCCELLVEPGRVVVRSDASAATPPYLLHFALWLAYGIATAGSRTIAFHASAVCQGGKAILFLGESGTGKSTHTRLWCEHIAGSELLNDDSPVVRVQSDTVVACGSPWSGKTPCYRAVCAPVAAIVRLSQAPHNRVVRLRGVAALGALLPSCPTALMNDKPLAANYYDTLSLILNQVPLYHLECLPDRAAAQLVFDTLKTDGRL